MDEILKKIDTEIGKQLELDKSAPTMKHLNIVLGLEMAKQYILSSQKEPIGNTERLIEACEFCKEDSYQELVFATNHENIETYCGVWIDHDKLHQKLVIEDYEDIDDEIKINYCPVCGRPLNQPIS